MGNTTNKGKLKIPNIFVYDEAKKNSKSMTATLLFFIMLLAFSLVSQGFSELKTQSRAPQVFNASSAANELVYMDIDTIYRPFACKSVAWKVTGYYCMATDESGESFAVFFKPGTLEEYGIEIPETAIEHVKLRVTGSVGKLSREYSNKVTADAGELGIAVPANTNIILSVGDRAPFINGISNILLGILFLGLIVLVMIWNIKDYYLHKSQIKEEEKDER